MLNWTDRRVTDLDAKGALVSLSMERTIESASTVVMTLRDPGGRIVGERAEGAGRQRRQAWTPARPSIRQAYKREPVAVDEGWNPITAPDVIGRAAEVELDGVVFRLVKVRYARATDEVELTFEDRIVYWLKRKRGEKRANRRLVTRAQFILSMLREVRARQYRFVCPELNRRQAVAELRPPRPTTTASPTPRPGPAWPPTPACGSAASARPGSSAGSAPRCSKPPTPRTPRRRPGWRSWRPAWWSRGCATSPTATAPPPGCCSC